MRYAELGLALFAGCVIGWWWGERPEALRAISWLDAMTAFGTVGAALGAVFIAWRTDRSRRLELRDRAWHYAALKVTALAEMRKKCSDTGFSVRSASDSDWKGKAATDIANRISAIENELNALDSLLLSKIDPKVGRLIFDASLSLYRARQYADDLPRTKNKISPHLDKAVGDLLEIIKVLDSTPEAQDF